MLLAVFLGRTEVIYAILFSLLSFVFNLTQVYENIHGFPHIQRRRDLIYSVIFVLITIVLSVYLRSSYLLRVFPVLAALFSMIDVSRAVFVAPGSTLLTVILN